MWIFSHYDVLTYTTDENPFRNNHNIDELFKYFYNIIENTTAFLCKLSKDRYECEALNTSYWAQIINDITVSPGGN